MFLFTLVRNPWDRMVSYYHWLRDQGFDHPAVSLAKGLTFAEFLTHSHTRAALAAESYGSYLNLPGRGELPATFVRLENLEDDLAPVEEHLGFPLAPLPAVNASARRAGYRQYFDDPLANLVGELYRADIDRFAYRF